MQLNESAHSQSPSEENLLFFFVEWKLNGKLVGRSFECYVNGKKVFHQNRTILLQLRYSKAEHNGWNFQFFITLDFLVSWLYFVIGYFEKVFWRKEKSVCGKGKLCEKKGGNLNFRKNIHKKSMKMFYNCGMCL